MPPASSRMFKVAMIQEVPEVLESAIRAAFKVKQSFRRPVWRDDGRQQLAECVSSLF